MSFGAAHNIQCCTVALNECIATTWLHIAHITCAMCIEIELCGIRVLHVESNFAHGCIHRRTLEPILPSLFLAWTLPLSLKLGVQTEWMSERDAGMQWMSCAIRTVFFSSSFFFFFSLFMIMVADASRSSVSFFYVNLYGRSMWTRAKIFCCGCVSCLRSKCFIL